ncbi:DUF202 domain-containing protein [Cryobacterium sp. SO2]|uniref:DUF202 domain-containing protein n=1 Tax=Cryobacterium sp. SO2 TaxID=1897060 RepID=UPI00223E440B|nr:DUF202 domain-containing protein [Cryobacterium sp. SO2]WEO76413.1 DUF202 domain-containing protein [Cryobacterium sp. SO2]
MPATTDHAVAVRATGFIGESRWRRRPVSRVRYDALWADGRVEFDVNLTAAMYRGWPTDFEPISDSVHANCPEVGTGRWVNGFAAVVDGPEVENPNPPGPRSGWPGRSGVANPRARLAWRLCLGVATLGVGILLLTRPAADGVLADISALCALFGLVTLARAVPRRFRWW